MVREEGRQEKAGTITLYCPNRGCPGSKVGTKGKIIKGHLVCEVCGYYPLRTKNKGFE